MNAVFEDVIAMAACDEDGKNNFLIRNTPGGAEIRAFNLVSRKTSLFAPPSEVPCEDICRPIPD